MPRYDIAVQDKVAPTIVRKISDISEKAKSAHNHIELLEKALKALDAGPLSALASASNLLNKTLEKEFKTKSKLTAATEKTALAQDRINRSYLQTESALQRAIAAETRAEIAQTKLNREGTKGLITQQKLAIEVQRTNAATSRAVAAQNRAEISSLKLNQAQKKLNKSVNQNNTAFGGFIRTLLAYAGITFGVREIFSLADGYTLLQNKIKNVTESEGQLVGVTERVFQVANETRTSVDATGQAFQRFDRALIGLGASQEESLRVTKTVNELLIAGGAATSEQTSGLLQLSQAFNKGKLDGDEFRTVMELMPGVADAIAKQLGVTQGELLKLAPDGVITADVMRKALLSVSDDVDKKFSKLVPTIGQGFTVMKNGAIQFLGEINKRFGITEKFSKLLISMGRNMGIVTTAISGLIALLAVGFAPAMLRALNSLKVFAAALATNPIALLVVGLTAAITYLAIFQDEIFVSTENMWTFGDVTKGVFATIQSDLKPVTEFFKAAWKSAFDTATENASGFQKFFGKILNGIGQWIKFTVNYWIRLFVGAYRIITETQWSKFPGFLKNIFFTAVNGAIDGINLLIKAVTIGLRVPVKFINEILESLGKNKIELDDFISIPKLDVEKNKITSFAQDVGNILNEVGNTDFLGGFIDRVKIATEEAKNLRILEGRRDKILRGDGVQSAIPGMKSKKTKKKTTYEAPVLPYEIQSGEGSAILNQFYDNAITKNVEFQKALKDTQTAYELGFASLDQYKKKITEIKLEMIDAKLAMGDATNQEIFISAFAKITEGFENVAMSIRDSFGNLFVNLRDGFADTIGNAIAKGEDLGKALKNVAQNAIGQLISSIIKMGIQWAATQALQTATATTALAAQTAASVAAATVTATAWAPAAAAVSLASFGGNSPPAAAGIKAVASIANSLPGFREGGYTGALSRDDIAGVVHGREFVMDAAAVERIGVANLESLRRGAASVSQNNQTVNNVTNQTVVQGTSNGSQNAAKNNVKIINVLDPEMLGEFLATENGTEVLFNFIRSNSEAIKPLLS